MKIKICGITSPEEIEFANELLPDYIGFVFAESRRRITPAQAAALKANLSPSVLAAGVFVNQDIGEIRELCEAGVLDLVQIHGDEDAAYLEALKKEINKPVIRAVRVRTRADVKNAVHIPADFILFDAYRRDSYGGTGATFDLELLEGFKRPFFLAGGLDQNNIAQSVRRIRPYCADVSSGAETDGKKDRRKMQNIINTVRSVE
jgi:phosphoribosylanthranilate isomerase